MGYTLPARTETLQFEDYPGLEVEVRNFPVDMDDYFGVIQALDEFGTRAATIDGLREINHYLADTVGKYLAAWSLDDPADASGLRRQPWEIVVAIATGWSQGVAEVPLPLPRRSASGGPSQAQPASPSRPSSRRRSSATRS